MAAINGFTRTKVDRFVVLKFSNSFERTKPAHENHVSPKHSRKPTRQTFSEMNPDNLMPLALGNHKPECSDVILRDLFICRNCRHFLRMLRRQTRLYHTCLQHSSPTLLYNASIQHFSPTLHHNTPSQHFPAKLLHNTSLQHSSPTLLYNTLLQHFSPRFLCKTLLQDLSTRLFSNTLLQQLSNSLQKKKPRCYPQQRLGNYASKENLRARLFPILGEVS